MNTSKELQEEIVASLLKNSYLFSISKDQITDAYFSDGSCKVIYKSLATYYSKYNSLPNLNEMLIIIDDCYSPVSGVSIAEVKDTCCRLYDKPEADESFIMDKMTGYIRTVRASGAFKDIVETLKSNPTGLESDELVARALKALEVQLTDTRVFLMNDINQVKEARLAAVGSGDQSKVIKSFIPSINNCLMFGGWQPSTVNMIVSPPGTGKSMYLINEGVNAAKQGFDVLHIFIGDMVNYDGFIRYLSCISGMEQKQLVMLTEEKQLSVVQFCNQQFNNIFDRLFILSYPSVSIGIEALMEDINKFEKHLEKDFGMIIIDYPDNLIQEGKSLYEDGGTLYSSIERLARLTKAVVMVASQPSRAYWNYSIIPLEAAAESSKKQQCVDVMLTFNAETRGAPIGTMLLAKARKGDVGKIFRIKTEFSKCQMNEIDEATFNSIKATLTPVQIGPGK